MEEKDFQKKFNKEFNKELQPEPKFIINGVVSDFPGHYEMLSNPVANKMADELAVAQAVAAGMTEEEMRRLQEGPPFNIEDLRPADTQKIDYLSILDKE